jgi:hypothetical protein
MNQSHFGLSVLAVSLLSGFACSKSTDREPAMRPASAVRADPETKSSTLNGINEISAAHCDREVRYGGVGPDEEYATRDQCIFELNSAGYDDLDAEACPNGLDQNEVGKCLSEIAAERCGAPLDTLERLVACRSATLCKD